MSRREDVDKESSIPRPRGRRPAPAGCGPRFGRIRVRFGDRGGETTWSDLAREMEIARERPWTWEIEGRFPGRSQLARLLAQLARVRDEGADPLELAKWVELGPDDAPPFDEPANPNDAQDPRRTVFQGSTEHRTPPGGTAFPVVVDPEVALERAMDDLRSGREDAIARALPKIEAAHSLLQAFKKARNAGLAGILVAGAVVTSGCSRINPQFGRGEITRFEDLVREDEGRARPSSKRRKAGA